MLGIRLGYQGAHQDPHALPLHYGLYIADDDVEPAARPNLQVQHALGCFPAPLCALRYRAPTCRRCEVGKAQGIAAIVVRRQLLLLWPGT